MIDSDAVDEVMPAQTPAQKLQAAWAAVQELEEQLHAQQFLAGMACERRAIVAFLRRSDKYHPWQELADMLERGEHRNEVKP